MLLKDFHRFSEALKELPLAKWQYHFTQILGGERSPEHHGDFLKWHQCFRDLPSIKPSEINLKGDTVAIGAPSDCSPEMQAALRERLKNFHPWRKGPYDFFGIHIDTEWHSDWKWRRISPHISDLRDRLVLDIGCGNGYHCWRMLGCGARFVLGIDPNYLFLMQFQVAKYYIGQKPVFLLPIGIEHMPHSMPVFDTVFSMGVLYHRRSPIDHLYDLRKLLAINGEIVLETLVIEGNKDPLLVPEDRYAKMRNVWFIPSCGMLENWMRRVGFADIRCVNVNHTTTAEQRSTKWMRFESLPDFLDPQDLSLTVEGYPAPVRAVFIARNPNVMT